MFSGLGNSVAQKVYSTVPRFFRRVVFEFFASVLCFFGGIPLVISEEAKSGALETLLPTWLVIGWGIVLTTSPIFIILGLVIQTRVVIQEVPFWMKIEAFGLSMLAAAGFLYCWALYLFAGISAFPAVVITLVFTLTCAYRSVEIYVEIEQFMEDIGARDARDQR